MIRAKCSEHKVDLYGLWCPWPGCPNGAKDDVVSVIFQGKVVRFRPERYTVKVGSKRVVRYKWRKA